MHRIGILVALPLVLATPAIAQEVTAGRVADSSVGKAGTRQTRDQIEQQTGQTRRLDLRISNRIQNRIRNRIDRNYVPQADSTASFEAAGQRSRKTAAPAPR